ncbi:uncharacterized protein LOC116015948 [Ipomoea triloba]|uniref:uncharacterized protein LOC116015948 n=1 Tax=Ipomoea triloba TaxID=35885 RepID=UPI00125CFDA3|nr:uncharacterized protein LOC116015948 [Ipomoea triloba]
MGGDFEQWISIWKIKVPLKWKTFLWKALGGTFPVTTNLHLRRVDVDLACPKCGLSHESVMHALVGCEFSQRVWNVSNLPIPSIVGISFDMWFSSVLHDLSEGEVGAVVAVLYHLWKARNSAVWEGFLPQPAKVTTSAFAALHAWKEVHGGHHSGSDSGSSSSLGAPALPSFHTAPEHSQTGVPRCFFDARFCPSSLKASFGAVLVSATGSFIAACAGPIPSCFSPLMAEAVASKEALSWLRDRGIPSVAVYTNCSQLRAYFSSNSAVLSHAGYAIEGSRLLLASFMSSVVGLVPRSANVIAHTLAASAFLQCKRIFSDQISSERVNQSSSKNELNDIIILRNN